MDNCKYIVLDEFHSENGIRDFLMILFPSIITHIEMSKQFPNSKIISAGFINLGSRYCYGESIGLKIKSNPPVDNLLLNRMYDD